MGSEMCIRDRYDALSFFVFRNSVEKLCDEWVLSTSVCGTGSFSAHTATHSTSESAHEAQSPSPRLRKPKKLPLIFFVLGVFIGSMTTLFACLPHRVAFLPYN